MTTGRINQVTIVKEPRDGARGNAKEKAMKPSPTRNTTQRSAQGSSKIHMRGFIFSAWRIPLGRRIFAPRCVACKDTTSLRNGSIVTPPRRREIPPPPQYSMPSCWVHIFLSTATEEVRKTRAPCRAVSNSLASHECKAGTSPQSHRLARASQRCTFGASCK